MELLDIRYSKRAIKQIKVLDAVMRKRIVSGIEKLPNGDIKRLEEFSSGFRLRVGDYRILFNLKMDSIEITDVLPRGKAYKK